jgi:hypothetical protein
MTINKLAAFPASIVTTPTMAAAIFPEGRCGHSQGQQQSDDSHSKKISFTTGTFHKTPPMFWVVTSYLFREVERVSAFTTIPTTINVPLSGMRRCLPKVRCRIASLAED